MVAVFRGQFGDLENEWGKVMADGRGFLDGVLPGVTQIQSDGYKFIGIGAAITLVGFFIWSTLGWIAGIATVCVALFFRDPDRVAPLREGLVLAASDGLVLTIDKVKPPTELLLDSAEVWRVATALSMSDVHVNRAPVAGRVLQSVYVPGAFLNPTLDKASEDNERRAVLFEMSSGKKLSVVQIAGLITRRILTFVHEGDSVGVGQRIGMIRFGSRVDVYLPEGATPLVSVGQRMVAGETVLADMKSEEPEREARRV
ncbi:MAG: phosphatidylserine decarboxylase [Pseudomonadota bacterium]